MVVAPMELLGLVSLASSIAGNLCEMTMHITTSCYLQLVGTLGSE